MRSEYTDEFEAFSEAYSREEYLYDSGRKASLDLEPVFDRYGYLFRAEEIEDLRVAAADAFHDRDRRALGYLRDAATEYHLDALVRPLTEEIASHAASATVRWGRREIPFLATRALAIREPRAEARRELESLRARVFEETNDLRAERLEKQHDGARSLGADSYLALWSDLRGVDYIALAESARQLLSATERPYAEALEPALTSRAEVRPADATRTDALHAFRLGDFARAFPGPRMPVVYRAALAGLGIRTGAQGNIRLDLDERPTKSPRAFCAAIRVPDEVVLSLRPSGGYQDYRALLHEAGHAQHFGYTSPDARVAFTRAGDRALSETYAFLFENLLLEPEFLGEFFGLGAAKPFVAVAALERAYFVRRYAGKLIYETWLHSAGALAGARERYVESLDEATRVRWPAAEHLSDVDDGLYVASYLRAWALEVQLRDHLKTRFGRQWWASRPAGDLLKELWATGKEYTADDLATELGLGAISFDPLEADVVERLRP